MTIIYLPECNTQCYAVTARNNGWIRVQKIEHISNDENIIYEVDPRETFLGKSESCELTAISGAFNKSVFDGNTILLRMCDENNKHRYAYIGRDMIYSFLTDDKISKYVSKMGNNLTPYSMAIGDKNVYFLTPHFKYISKKLIDDELINQDEDTVDLFNYLLSNYEKDTFRKLQIDKIPSNFD